MPNIVIYGEKIMKEFEGDSCSEIKVNMNNIKMVMDSMIEDNEIIMLSEVFKVLGDPTRIKIIFALSKCELCVCDIVEAIGMTQSAVSHQLRLLRNLKLVKFRKEGKSVIYSLDDDHILQLFNQGMEHIKHS
jgi:ArsR family transcriptional regulator, lead/cadmium/zinc/bismuth-responsive transcriptional repressor